MLRLLPTLEKNNIRVVLGSSSPRRLELLTGNVFGGRIKIEVVPSGFAEDYDKSLYVGKAKEYVEEYALRKAEDVENQLVVSNGRPTLIIGADTVVVNNEGKILEKPADKAHAIEMLKSYSRDSMKVITGFCLILLQEDGVSRKHVVSSCESSVNFGPIDHGLAEAYVESGESYGKAGGFAIQGIGATLISSIDGCYFNIVGLPVYQLSQSICQLIDF